MHAWKIVFIAFYFNFVFSCESASAALSLLFYTIFSGSYNLINKIHCERMNEWALCKLHSCYCCCSVSLSLGTCAFWIAKICVCFCCCCCWLFSTYFVSTFCVRACVHLNGFRIGFSVAPKIQPNSYAILLGYFSLFFLLSMHAYVWHILCSMWFSFRFHIYLICIRLDDMVDFDWMTSSWWILPSQHRRNGHTHTPNTHKPKR